MGFFDFLFSRSKKTNTKSQTHQHNPATDSLESYAQKRSEAFLNHHKDNVGDIELFTFNPDENCNLQLGPKELAFLKYLPGKNPATIAGYWTHNVNIKINKLLKDLISHGYIEYKANPEKSLRVADLKSLLAKKGQKVSGKKSELIERFLASYSDTEIEQMDIPKSFALTEKGLETVKDIPFSLSHDHILDKKCIDHIKVKRYKEAYILVCDMEMKKPVPRGMGISWEHEKKHPERFLNQNVNFYNNILKLDAVEKPETNKTYNALFVYAHMLGGLKVPTKVMRDWAPEYFSEPDADRMHEICEHLEHKYENCPYKKDNTQDETSFESCYYKGVYADIYLRAGRFDKALPLYEEIIALNWEGSRAYDDAIKIYKDYGFYKSVDRLNKRKSIIVN